MDDHEFGLVPHDWIILHIKISQIFFTPPTSNETDDVSIHAGKEEYHGAVHQKEPYRDIFVCETQMGPR